MTPCPIGALDPHARSETNDLNVVYAFVLRVQPSLRNAVVFLCARTRRWKRRAIVSGSLRNRWVLTTWVVVSKDGTSPEGGERAQPMAQAMGRTRNEEPSREAAKERSPRRKPWVRSKGEAPSPEGAEETAAYVVSTRSRAMPPLSSRAQERDSFSEPRSGVEGALLAI